jgi:hypothetical protein
LQSAELVLRGVATLLNNKRLQAIVPEPFAILGHTKRRRHCLMRRWDDISNFFLHRRYRHKEKHQARLASNQDSAKRKKAMP